MTVPGPRALLLAVLLAAAGCPLAMAQVAAAPVIAEQGPKWAALTPAQQSALAPLRDEWLQIDSARKRKWIEIAARFPNMSPDEQARVQERMTEWTRLSPAERGRARVQFQEARQLPAQDRQQRWEAYRALPEDERRALAGKATPAAAVVPARSAASNRRTDESSAKRNVVPTPPGPSMPPKSVAPVVVQAQPGATTNLVSKQAAPPPYHQAGLPKIAATKGFVDPETLLPKRGPQGAAMTPAPAAPPAAAPASGRQ